MRRFLAQGCDKDYHGSDHQHRGEEEGRAGQENAAGGGEYPENPCHHQVPSYHGQRVQAGQHALQFALLIGGRAAALQRLQGWARDAAQGPIIQWLALLGGLVLAVVVFLLSVPGRQLVGFGQDAWREVNKVVWPTRKESTQMTLYVFGFVVLMALFLWFTDKTLEWVFYDLILGWKK